MAVDSLVDKTKLNNSLSYEADRIRLKTGGSADIAFDFANEKGFGDAIDAIPTGGGGISADDFAKFIAGQAVDIDVSKVATMRDYSFRYAHLAKAFFPALTSGGEYGFGFFTVDTGAIVVPAITALKYRFAQYGGSGFSKIDAGPSCGTINGYAFSSCSALNILILRKTTIVSLANTTPFTGTPFASDGSGGTIYIPKSLYDHLGDGTSLDYKAATNWSTIDGYGTITWAQIEGSIYETQYADGTPIT